MSQYRNDAAGGRVDWLLLALKMEWGWELRNVDSI